MGADFGGEEADFLLRAADSDQFERDFDPLRIRQPDFQPALPGPLPGDEDGGFLADDALLEVRPEADAGGVDDVTDERAPRYWLLRESHFHLVVA